MLFAFRKHLPVPEGASGNMVFGAAAIIVDVAKEPADVMEESTGLGLSKISWGLPPSIPLIAKYADPLL